MTAEADYGNIRIRGFIGKPVISRGNRNYENYFVNGRYVKSTIIARAIEDAYKAFMMSHRYPFTVLQIEVNTEEVDVNVHPQKLEVRFANQQEIYEKVLQTVKEALLGKELIPEFTIDGPKKAAEEKRPDGRPSGSMSTGRTGSSSQGSTAANVPDTDKKARYPEPFEKIRSQLIAEANSPYEIKYPQRDRRSGLMKPVTGSIVSAGDNASQPKPPMSEKIPVPEKTPVSEKLPVPEKTPVSEKAPVPEKIPVPEKTPTPEKPPVPEKASVSEKIPVPEKAAVPENNVQDQALARDIARRKKEEADRRDVQMELFSDKLLTEESRARHKLIGQVFDTYWIVEFEEKMYIIDQHAAHEKVMYERFMKQYQEKRQTSQMITPPVIVTLSLQEETLLKRHLPEFRAVGFEIEPFGGREYAISAVPDNLYGLASRELFLEILDGLSDVSGQASNQIVLEKIASMSCKAAVKGNSHLSTAEADALISELLTLENPYNCPHGRPTIITMTKYEMEKKFKRVL